VAEVYTKSGSPVQFRSHSEVGRFFDGLDLVDPGICCCHRWRPTESVTGAAEITDAQISLLAGVGIKR
ncbi:SAM-dependent methyltransferase, partial [Streptomyces niveus]